MQHKNIKLFSILINLFKEFSRAPCQVLESNKNKTDYNTKIFKKNNLPGNIISVDTSRIVLRTFYLSKKTCSNFKIYKCS